MSTNCLVRKYKAVVNNDSLLRLGDIVVPINTGGFSIASSKDITIKADKEALSLTSGGTGSKSVVIPGTSSSTPTNVFVTQECVVYIPQYDLLRLATSPIADIDYKYVGANSVRVIISLQNSNNLRYNLGTLPKNAFDVAAGQYSFNLDWDSYPVLKSIQANYNSALNISLSELAEKAPLLETLNLALSTAQMTGSLDDLGKCKLITGAKGIVRGTIEGFVTSERTAYGERAARTTGNAVITGNNITFQGTAIGSGDHNLSWTATTITFDGTTITA